MDSGTATLARSSFIGTLTVMVRMSPPTRYTAAATRKYPVARRRVARQANAPVRASATGVRRNAGKNTAFRTEAFISCMAAIATLGSAASSPDIIEQTQA